MINIKRFISIFIVLSFFTVFTTYSYPAQKKSSESKIININTAKIDQLAELPRIGKKTAKRIIEFRSKNGKFKRVQDLMKVKGIGEKIFKKLKRLITV